jgi:hypothetical protein
MITKVDSCLCNDLAAFNLRYCCEDCAHFEAEKHECSLGFGSAQHRARAVKPGDSLVFCKTFELA